MMCQNTFGGKMIISLYEIILKDKIDSQNQNLKVTPSLLFKISYRRS